MAGGRVTAASFCAGWRTLTPDKGNDRITQCDSVCPHKGNDRITQCDSVCLVYGKPPTRQVHSIPIRVSGRGHTRKRNTSTLIRGCHQYARKSASKAVLSRIQLTLHATRPTPHGASRLVLAMSAWSVKTRRAPSRHCRGARVLRSYDYGLSLIHI